MTKKVFLLSSYLSCLGCISAMAQEVKSPQEIQLELDQAQKDFETAQSMFIPWYTGPLITGSANNVPKGKTNLQLYIFFLWQYGQYANNRHMHRVPSIYTLNPLLVIQRGLTDWLDFTIVPQVFFRWREGKSAQKIGDTAVTFGFQLVKETPYVPSIRFTFGETFPTGKYQHLNANKAGIDSTGSGTYETVIGLNVSKIFWWSKLHPTAIRLATNYSIPDHDAKVRGFNSYGGGFGTDGHVRVGNTLNIDLGVEVSINQRWVFATDVAYTYSERNLFSGNPGLTALGTPAANGSPTSDQLSFAPAIEYNVSENGGFIGGIWFTVTGRNSASFLGVVLSYTYLF